MQLTDRHRAAEQRFTQLLDHAALPQPDRVEYEPDSLIFFWDDQKAAVVVDLHDAADAAA